MAAGRVGVVAWLLISCRGARITSTLPETEFEGCFAADLLVAKVPEYNPSKACWEKCANEGTPRVIVIGARWCGCPSDGPLGAGSTNCQLLCNFITTTDCACYHGDPAVYDREAQLLTSQFVKSLPQPNKFQGYGCTDTSHRHIEHLLPSPVDTRAHQCVSNTCRKLHRKYGAYLVGYKCGCKKTSDPLDDTFLPVTKECRARVVCMELPESVCLCGNHRVSALSYISKSGYGPLLASDRFHCYLMDQISREARVKRINQYGVIRKNRVQPAECLDICLKEQYGFAGVRHGGVCGCQNHVGHRKLTNEDCWSTCEAGGTGCGGPYTASVYSSKTGIVVDECRGNTDDCNRVSTTCKNSAKTYHCECKPGFQRLNRTHCKDIDECERKTHNCDSTMTVCNNTMGAFECRCRSGYRRLDNSHCRDVDECDEHVSLCGKNSRCSNTVGSFLCDCLHGFGLTPVGCEDVDECNRHSHDCDHSTSQCVNTDGGFRCQCRLGFHRLDNKTCSDVDECSTDMSSCEPPKQCRNTVGSYACECMSGYKPAGDGCEDVDECKFNSHNCDTKTTLCVNTEGGYGCKCQAGYKYLDDSRCQDIDECLTSQKLCVTCSNTIGGFVCQCFPGFRQSGRECVDVDECSESPGICTSSADCQNVVGSYRCTCHQGYTLEVGSHTTCVDVNECLEKRLHSCRAPKSSCYNTPGSYTCPCHWGYSGDGRSLCKDIDECGEGVSVCAEHAACTNTMGSYGCTCWAGYSGDGKRCEEMISRFDLEMLLEKVTKLPNVGRAPKPDRRYGSNMIDDSSELEKLLNEMTDSPLKTTVPPVKNYPGLYIGGSENPAEQLIGSQDNDPWDGSHPSEPLRPSDNSKVNGILDDIEKDFPSSVDVSPGGGEGEASMNMILDQILEHEKSIVHATGSPHYVKDIAPPAPTKLPGPQASVVRVKLKDPVILNTVSEVLEVVGHPEKPHVVPTDFVVPDDKVLTDILGDPDLNYVERKVTKTNMDLILDRVIIHEKQGPAVLQGNTKLPTTVKPRPETNPTPGEAGQVITTQNLNYIEPANALLDITDEVIEEDKQYPGPLTHDDDTLIPLNSVKEPIVPTVGGRLGLAQKYEPGSIHGHRVRRSVNNPGVRQRWLSEEDMVRIWAVMIACLLIAGLGVGCVW